MTKKLVFTAPDSATAAQVVEFLKSQGLDESHISVVGSEATELSAVPDPGGATGLLAGLGAALVAPGLAIGGAALALATTGGATFGVLASSLIGSSVTNSQIREYEQIIERGELLMVVEVDEDQKADIRSQLQSRFTAVQFMGEVDAIPPIV